MIYIYIFLLLILILFLIPLKIQLYYEFTDESKYKTTISYLFGFFKKELDSASENVKDDNKKNNKKNNKINIDILYYFQYFIDKGNIRKLYFRTNIGFKDPSLLGTSIGIVWSIINILFGYLLRNNDIDKIRDKDIQVVPLFDQDIFELFFLCIIKVNLVYIITAYIRILKTRKGGDSIARASNRRINENYNE